MCRLYCRFYPQDTQGEDGRTRRRLGAFYVVFLGLVANLGCVSPGMTLGFSAVALPQMKNQNATFHIDDDQASWMASLASISTAVGCLISGSLMERFGRRQAILGLNFPGVVGWLLIAFAHGPATMGMIYAGRILTGLATGMCASPPAVYSAEISTDKLRGMMVTWTSLAVALGILLIYILGYIIDDNWRLLAGISAAGPMMVTWTSLVVALGILLIYILGYIIDDNWRLLAGISAALPVLAFTLGYIFLPESPTWLTNKKRYEEALKVRENLHGSAVRCDLSVITPSNQKPQGSLLKAFLSVTFLRPFIIMNLFFFFQQFSGIFVIVFYAVDIIIEAGIDFDPNLIAVLLGATRFFVTIVVSYMSNRYGRRPMAIVSGAGMILCMGCLATYVYLQTTGSISEELHTSLSWIPVVSLIMYILTSTIGFLTLPWAMVGEVYPSRVRGTAAGLTTCLAYTYNFIIIKIYPSMVHTLDRYGLFFFYGAISVVGTIFVIIFLPETKGKNMAEIEMQYKKSKNVSRDCEQQPLRELENKIIIVPAK